MRFDEFGRLLLNFGRGFADDFNAADNGVPRLRIF